MTLIPFLLLCSAAHGGPLGPSAAAPTRQPVPAPAVHATGTASVPPAASPAPRAVTRPTPPPEETSNPWRGQMPAADAPVAAGSPRPARHPASRVAPTTPDGKHVMMMDMTAPNAPSTARGVSSTVPSPPVWRPPKPDLDEVDYSEEQQINRRLEIRRKRNGY